MRTGQRDKLKILPWAGTAKIRDGTGRDSQNPVRDAGQNGTEQKKDVLKQRDKETGKTFFPGTKGQGIFLSRDKGTSRPGLSLGNPTFGYHLEQNTNEIFSRISALTSKKRSNQKKKIITLLYTN